MKKIFKLSLVIFALLITGLSLFFIWASSSTYPVENYTSTFQIDIRPNKNNDSIYSIATYNIGYLSGMTNNKAIPKPDSLFSKNLNKVKSQFDSLQIDILAFQEIDYASARSFNINQQNEIASLGYPYVAQAVNWDKRYVPFPYWPPALHFRKVLSGQSILSKYPIIDHKRIVLDRVTSNPFYREALYLDRLAQVIRVSIDSRELIIINVHLEAYDKDTRELQFNKILDLYTAYAQNNPTILLGDFNSAASDSSAIVQKLINNPAVGNAAYLNSTTGFTFSSIDPFKRIDYIFYSKQSIHYLEGKILKDFQQASDHLPVAMWFKFK